MILQILTRGKPDKSKIPTDPRNDQALAILLLGIAPLGMKLLSSSFLTIVSSLFLLALFGAGFWLISLGLKAQKDYDAARTAQAPRPYRLMGAALVGVGVGLLDFLRFGLPIEPFTLGFLSMGLSLVAFGMDPRKAKGLDTPMDVQRDRADKLVVASQEKLSDMRHNIAVLADRELAEYFQDFETTVNTMLRLMHHDPARLQGLRKHLVVYLDAAAQATQNFTMLYLGQPDPAAKADFMHLLADLAEDFQTRSDQYAQDGKTRLKVDLDLLRDRLKQGRSSA